MLQEAFGLSEDLIRSVWVTPRHQVGVRDS